MSRPWFLESRDSAVLALHVQPGARHTRIEGTHGERLKIRLAAPPHDGRANRALVEFLAKEFAVPKSSVKLLRGTRQRAKTIRVEKPFVSPDWLEAASPEPTSRHR